MKVQLFRGWGQALEINVNVIHVHCSQVVFFNYLQSPSSALLADGVSENPNLMDNWDDAEGYYRKWTCTSKFDQESSN